MLNSVFDVQTQLSLAASELLSLPQNPGERVFILFVLSGFVLAFAVAMANGHTKLTLSQAKLLFSRKYWMTKDSVVDLSLLSFNSVLRLLLLVPLVGGQFALAYWAAGQLTQATGVVPHIDIPWFWIAASYTLVFFICEDFSRFYLHRLMHKVPLLWRFHKVHHSAKHLTPLTLYRIHPVEMTLFFTRSVLVFGLVTGLFIYLFQGRLSAWEILGVDALGFLFNMAAANLRHSPIWLSFGKWEKLFISPAQHQIHHSRAPEHHDKNFGVCFACWDKWFGSWVGAKEPQIIDFGVAAPRK